MVCWSFWWKYLPYFHSKEEVLKNKIYRLLDWVCCFFFEVNENDSVWVAHYILMRWISKLQWKCWLQISTLQRTPLLSLIENAVERSGNKLQTLGFFNNTSMAPLPALNLYDSNKTLYYCKRMQCLYLKLITDSFKDYWCSVNKASVNFFLWKSLQIFMWKQLKQKIY